jgi:hypothetical protein
LSIFNEKKIGDIFGVFLEYLNWTDFGKIGKILPNFQYHNLLKKILLRAHSLLVVGSYKEKKVLPYAFIFGCKNLEICLSLQFQSFKKNRQKLEKKRKNKSPHFYTWFK